MTDRIHALTVTLEHDKRDDDCEELIKAIRMMRGVIDVQAHVSDMELHTAEMRAQGQVSETFYRLGNLMHRRGGLGDVIKALKGLVDD